MMGGVLTADHPAPHICNDPSIIICFQTTKEACYNVQPIQPALNLPLPLIPTL